MALESNNFVDLYNKPQAYTVQTQPSAVSNAVQNASDSPKLAAQPDKDSFGSDEKKQSLTGKQKGLIAAAITVVAGAIIYFATRGKKGAKITEDGVKTAAKETEKNVGSVVGEKILKNEAETIVEGSQNKTTQKIITNVSENIKKEPPIEAQGVTNKIVEEDKKVVNVIDPKPVDNTANVVEIAEDSAKKAVSDVEKNVSEDVAEKSAEEARLEAQKEAKEKAAKELKLKAAKEAQEKAAELKLKQEAIKKADEIWTDPKQRAILEDFFKNEKINTTISNTNCTPITCTVDEALTNSIKGKYENVPEYLYHGTSPENCKNIQSKGFDLTKCSRGESGQGVYFGFSEDAVKSAYGGSIVKVKYAGKGIAKVQSGIVDNLIRNNSVHFAFEEKLGIQALEEKSSQVIGDLMNRYFKEKLGSMGYDAVYVPYSHMANCGYIAVFDPKSINIIK